MFKLLKPLAAFVSSVAIIAYFVQALLFPEANASWIYSSAIIIFVVEFLSIHSTAMMMGGVISKNKKKNATYLFFFYLFFTIVLTVVFKNYILPFFFILSTFIKLFTVEYLEVKKVYLFIAVFSFLIPLILVLISAPFLENLFPFPQEVLLAKPKEATGLFVDVPQTILAWGVIYFSAQFLINLFLLIKNWALKQVSNPV